MSAKKSETESESSPVLWREGFVKEMTSALSGSKSELVVDGESDDAEVESRNV